MARVSRPAKVEEWTDRLSRFASSTVTVAEFCKAEGVSQQSYYHWKRKLRDAAAAPPAGGRFRAVRVSPVGRLPSEPTTIQLGNGMRIELGTDLSVAELVVTRVLDVVAYGNGPTTPTKAK